MRTGWRLSIAKKAQEKYCEYTKAVFYKLRQRIDEQQRKQRREQDRSENEDTDTDEERKEKHKSRRRPNITP